jgi:hypothetical protein
MHDRQDQVLGGILRELYTTDESTLLTRTPRNARRLYTMDKICFSSTFNVATQINGHGIAPLYRDRLWSGENESRYFSIAFTLPIVEPY